MGGKERSKHQGFKSHELNQDLESFKANVDVEKNQLLEMHKEIEDDHERQNAELEAIREDINSQRQNLEAMMQKVIKQLPVGDRND
ncbi:hypothetical protein R6Q59_016185 [Mikania micrantha]